MWLDAGAPDPMFTSTLELDMGTVVPSLAGPKRPQDRVALTEVDDVFNARPGRDLQEGQHPRCGRGQGLHDIGDGDVVIAAITSCTNTSNPGVLVAAGLVAKKANELGLKPKPWVKTSLAPGSQVVTDYLVKAGPAASISTRSGSTWSAMAAPPASAIPARWPNRSARRSTTTISSPPRCISGNRNFEGRVSPDVRANFLASPPLVVAYALKGTVTEDFTTTPIGTGTDGRTCLPQGHLADATTKSPATMAALHRPRDVPGALCRRLQGRRALAGDRRHRQRNLSVARRQHLCRQPALFRGHDA